MGFIADHTLAVAMVVIILALIWEFGIKPRLGLTNREIEKKITDTIDEVEENLSTNLNLDQGNIMDEDSMPFSNQEKI